jgi:hypothetical protein
MEKKYLEIFTAHRDPDEKPIGEVYMPYFFEQYNLAIERINELEKRIEKLEKK